MHYIFRTFNVGAGDCITLLLQNGDEELHIMVDCGSYTTEVNDYIVQTFKKRIDYLLITHIDNDHINGIIAMLSAMPELELGHILYNCYQRTSEHLEEWDDKMKANVKRLYGHLPEVIDMVECKINAEASRTLAEIILNNESWKAAWRREYVTSDTSPIDLGGGMGRIVFLSPNKAALENLDEQYRKLFWQKLYKGKSSDYNNEETIYEALMRVVSEEPDETREELVSATSLDRNSLMRYADEIVSEMSDSNMASIAFVWEQGNHGILFLGDASPKIVANEINEKYIDRPKPIMFDLIKVSHHGSAHSTSRNLINVADSEHFFVTGGSKLRPSIQTLARIVTAKLPDGITHREIRYNRKNNIIESLDRASELKEEFCFSIVANGNEYELFY